MRQRAIGLYRGLIRAADGMPTKNRREFVLHRTRVEFRSNAAVDPKEAQFLLDLAETHLETVKVQAAHLTAVGSRYAWSRQSLGPAQS